MASQCPFCNGPFPTSRSLSGHIPSCAKKCRALALDHGMKREQVSQNKPTLRMQTLTTAQMSTMLQQQCAAPSTTGAAYNVMLQAQTQHNEQYAENVRNIGNGDDMRQPDDNITDSNEDIDFTSSDANNNNTDDFKIGQVDVATLGTVYDVDNLEIRNDQMYRNYNDIFSNTDDETNENDMHTGHAATTNGFHNNFTNVNGVKFDCEGTPPAMAAGVHLMFILAKHSADVGLYNDLVDFIDHQTALGFNFSKQRLPKKDSLLSKCTSMFNLQGLQPVMMPVRVQSCVTRQVHVPVFDLRVVLQKMLQNPSLMNTSNFAADLDIFTGKPIGERHWTHVSEIHTAQAWEPARARHCGDHPQCFPCGLVFFYDKSHYDRHGALALAPFMITCSFFSTEARGKPEFWEVLGYVPNLRLGVSADDPATSAQKLQDEHACISEIIKQLGDIQKEGGIPMMVMGRNVVVRPWIHFGVGDTEGNNGLTGHYNNSGNQKIKCGYRDCLCPPRDLGNSSPECVYITRALVLERQAQGGVALKAISKHPIRNAFDNANIPMSCPTYGIYKSTPPEVLHTLDSGLIEYALQVFANYFDGKAKERDTLHRIHIAMCKHIKMQSEHDLPRPSTRNGITETTKQQAAEHVGNFFMILCSSYTTFGRDTIEPNLPPGVTMTRFRKCIIRILATRQWLLANSIPRSELDPVRDIITKAIDELKACFPRNTGNEWTLSKVHGFTKFVEYIIRFGVPLNFFGGYGESHLKSKFKHPAKNTQKRPALFAQQTSNCLYTSLVVHHSFECLQQQLKFDFERITDQDETSARQGMHIATFGPRNRHGQYERQLDWKDKGKMEKEVTATGKRKTISGSAMVPIDDLFWHTLNTFVTSTGHRDEFQVCGFTSVRIQNRDTAEIGESSIYRVSACYRGEPRNDWCMVMSHAYTEEARDDFDGWANTCPGRLHGFFRFITPGTPTPKLLERYSVDQIRRTKMEDQTLYAVLHCASTFVTWREMEMNFVVDFALGHIKQSVYILSVDRITDPLFVYHKLGAPNNEFFCVLPKRYWKYNLHYDLISTTQSKHEPSSGRSHKHINALFLS